MARLGFAYYSNPYKDAAYKASRMLLSGGLGYRNKGFFIDLSYVHAMNKDVSFPYRLEDRANTYATLKQQRGNIVATVGCKMVARTHCLEMPRSFSGHFFIDQIGLS